MTSWRLQFELEDPPRYAGLLRAEKEDLSRLKTDGLKLRLLNEFPQQPRSGKKGELCVRLAECLVASKHQLQPGPVDPDLDREDPQAAEIGKVVDDDG
jgi:hypothetical protein